MRKPIELFSPIWYAYCKKSTGCAAGLGMEKEVEI